MFLTRTTRRFATWLAMLAMVMGALAPTVAQAVVASQGGAGWVQVCSASGMVWVQADAVEVVVHRLRKKLVGTNAEIVTLRGVGYLLCDADSMAAQKGDKVDKAEKGGALR